MPGVEKERIIMRETILGISEEASIVIDKLLLEGKKIPAIRLYRIIRECTIGVAKDKMEARQVYLCDIGLAVMVKDRRYCDATTDGKAWLVEHGEEPVKLNPKRHFYLYAKGHYERGDMIADLKKIACAYCGQDYINEDGLIILIGSEAYKYVNENNFVEIFREAHPGSIRSTIFLNREGSYAVRILGQLLYLLRHTDVKKKDAGREWQWIINLGEADPEILPLSKSEENYRIDEQKGVDSE